jgi:hypothetical protein
VTAAAERRGLLLVCLAGLMLRVVFVVFAAESYFGRPDFGVGGDTAAWSSAIVNLIERGAYTSNPESPLRYFGRMPGYAFFIGLFYLLAGRGLPAAYAIIPWVQAALDTAAIALLYGIARPAFGRGPALLLAGFYATYPFVIVWTQVVYSETLGLFLTLLSGFFFMAPQRCGREALAGAALGVAALVVRRPCCYSP